MPPMSSANSEHSLPSAAGTRTRPSLRVREGTACLSSRKWPGHFSRSVDGERTISAHSLARSPSAAKGTPFNVARARAAVRAMPGPLQRRPAAGSPEHQASLQALGLGLAQRDTSSQQRRPDWSPGLPTTVTSLQPFPPHFFGSGLAEGMSGPGPFSRHRDGV